MMTLRRSAPSPVMTCFRRSCVRGRANFTPASSIAMALASAGPIQIGSTRSPSRSCRITTGVLVVRSSPRWATRTSMTPSLGAKVPRGQVFPLFRGQRVDPHPHRLQLQAGDLAIQFPWNAVYVPAEPCPLLHHVLRRQSLVRERHVHHARRVPLRRREVHQPSVGEHIHPLPAEPPLLHQFAHPPGALGRPPQRVQVDLHVEVPRVRDDRAVLHGPHVLEADHVDVPDRKSTRLNSSHGYISYAVFCLKKKNTTLFTC